jgi:hypothetical protein
MLDKCVFKLRRDFAVEVFFSYEPLNARKEKNSYRQATYEESRFPPIRDTSAALKIQASYFDKPFVITRPTQDEYVKDGPQRT